MKAQITLTLDSGKKITLSCDEVKELMALLEAYRATTEPLPMQPWFPRGRKGWMGVPRNGGVDRL